MTNLDYFQYSIDNISLDLDFSNKKGSLVIPLNVKEENELTRANEEIIELITAYSKLKELKVKSEKQIKEILINLILIIENTKYINYSAFCVYFSVVGYSYSLYMKQSNSMSKDEKISLIRKIADSYIEERHKIYLSHGYSNQSLQVMSDASSSKGKGKTGINNIINILKTYDFVKVSSFKQFEENSYVYILPDKGDIDIMLEILKKYKIQFRFRSERQNKNPDVIFRIKKDIFICEHKLTNGGGGTQNTEINEIIAFINQTENNKKIHYLSCLQGYSFESLNGFSTQSKHIVQYNDIIVYLEKHKQNYFVNEAGLEKIVKDYCG